MTTYGQIDAHFLRLLYILAQKRAEMVHTLYRLSTPIERLFGAFFAQSRARLGAAMARGMALRAFGCSSFGFSKVFLQHIAPTRYQDQTLSAGEHLAAGLTLALAAWVFTPWSVTFRSQFLVVFVSISLAAILTYL
jgi:hypothetical protein